MIPSFWYSPAVATLWQVTLHSWIAAAVFYVWGRYQGLPSGRTRRWVLVMVLLVPMATASVPGRNGFDFRDRWAWLDSSRMLSVELFAAVRVWHVVLAMAAATATATVAQEVLPLLRRPSPPPDFEAAPEALVRRVRELPGWQACRVAVLADDGIALETAGRPGSPRLIISRGALDQLAEDELEVVLSHENAHWQQGRWWVAHLLFAVRLLQIYNPVALGAFREYTVESEIDCDSEAVAGSDPRALARVLFRIYQTTSTRDLAARGTLRRRVDILLGRAERSDDALPPATVLAGGLLLLVLLPWVV